VIHSSVAWVLLASDLLGLPWLGKVVFFDCFPFSRFLLELSCFWGTTLDVQSCGSSFYWGQQWLVTPFLGVVGVGWADVALSPIPAAKLTKGEPPVFRFSCVFGF